MGWGGDAPPPSLSAPPPPRPALPRGRRRRDPLSGGVPVCLWFCGWRQLARARGGGLQAYTRPTPGLHQAYTSGQHNRRHALTQLQSTVRRMDVLAPERSVSGGWTGGGECGAPRGRGAGIHGIRGDSGGVPARGPGFSSDLCPRARPSPPVFTLRKHSTGRGANCANGVDARRPAKAGVFVLGWGRGAAVVTGLSIPHPSMRMPTPTRLSSVYQSSASSG